ncbi:hypothetical protein M440DRAFT_1394720 [Trichoderma longibrachiatum ATCC 18648]|uniref:Uncharacterized protein n=1 Tax=Trichoderma longibrachiatum ATCC 18648 TaxID=983965 RepID=A0A2T4BUK4_TRILO|nr:hypothetical protein M440DRAFT_1394720 [Trichoderma longibrachiatum ATCC 18648]
MLFAAKTLEGIRSHRAKTSASIDQTTHLPPKQRQQQQQHALSQPPQEPPTRLSTPSTPHRSLRRTPKFDSAPTPTPTFTSKPQPERRVHIAAASAGFYPSIVSLADSDSSITGLGLSLFDEADGEKHQQSQTQQRSREDPPGTANPPNPETSSDVAQPRLKTPRISKHTHDAILFALEEALRGPHPFTADEVEESASMSDLMTGGHPANGAALAPGSDLDPEDYDTPATTNPSGANMPSSTSGPQPQWTGAYSNPQDYSGQGYGTPGWDTVPRHHHPTRLSDVMEEEDERSRTSASQSRI